MPKKPSVTVKEVAAHAGVSVATVSRAMQLPDKVAADTVAQVMRSIAALGYRPNPHARNLRTSRTHLIVTLVPNLANPFFVEVIRGIEEVALQQGYSVLIGESRMDAAREQSYVNLIAGGHADGLITFTGRTPWPRAEGQLPVINACSDFSDKKVTSVDVDNVAAARSAVDYLIALGHHDIGFVTGGPNSPNSLGRLAGYRAALEAAGLAVDPKHISDGNFTIESGIRAVETLLDRNPNLTAIFCANDEMALGVIKGAKARGRRVPEDLSVIGFDDINFAKHFDPPLTTIAQPMGDIGREAIGLLLEILNDPATPPRKRVLPASLVIRGSTAPRAR